MSLTNTTIGHLGRFVQNRTLATTSGKEIALSIGYDDHRRITSIANTVADPATDLMSFSLGRDVLGNLTASDATGAGQLDVGYTYDVLNRLVTAAYDTGSESFDMDSLGNRNNYTDSRDGDAITYGANNPVNEYTTIEGIGVAYDAAGNLITDELGIGYTYDVDNRLVGIASSTETLSFDYDALGRRIRKTNGADSTLYYYDGENVIAEYDGTGALLRTYIHGHQYVDERAVMTAAGIDSYYLIGNLYSVSGLADANGAIVESYTYDAYGDVQIADGTGANIPVSALCNPYAFTGRRIDWLQTTDAQPKALYHYRARTYDPNHGRFAQRDPYGMGDGIEGGQTGGAAVDLAGEPNVHSPTRSLTRHRLSPNQFNQDPRKTSVPQQQVHPLPGTPPLSQVYVDGMNLYEYVKSAPITFTDWDGQQSNGGFLAYGNWCGPAGGGPNAAIDCMDSACCVHDNCYLKKFGRNGPGALRQALHLLLGFPYYDRDLRDCDRDLCRRLYCMGRQENKKAQQYRIIAMTIFQCHTRYILFHNFDCNKYSAYKSNGSSNNPYNSVDCRPGAKPPCPNSKCK